MSSTAEHTELVARARLALGREPDLTLWQVVQGGGRTHAGTFRRFGMTRGAADLVGILAPTGRMICLEAKTGKSRQSKEQRMFAELVRKRGGFYAVLRSVDEAVAAIRRARHGEGE